MGRARSLFRAGLDRHLDAVNATQPSWVVIDATGLSFCGTADVRAIVRAHYTCIQRGTKMRLVGLQRAVERVFELTRLRAHTATD